MKVIEPSFELLNAPLYPELLHLVETAGRTYYKSHVGNVVKYVARAKHKNN